MGRIGYKFLAIMMVLLISMSILAACGGTDKNSADGTTTSGSKATSSEASTGELPKVTLSLRHIASGEALDASVNAIIDSIDRFKKENSNVEVKVEALDHDTHRAKLKAEIAGGEPPELFYTWGYSFSEPFYKAGKLLDITPLLQKYPEWKAGFAPGVLEAFHYGDGFYGIPSDGFAEGIFYNKEIFTKLGISPPDTFERFIEIVKIIKDNKIIPIAMGNKEKWPGTFAHNYFFERQAGYDLYQKLMNRESGYSWVNEDYIKANEKVSQLVKMGAFPEGMVGITRDEGTALFYQGNAAMYIDGSFATGGFISDAAPEGFIEKVGFINFPAFSDGKGDQKSIIAGFTYGFSISADVKGTDKEEPAMELLKYLNDDIYSESLLYSANKIPSRMIKDIDKTRTNSLMAEIINVLGSASKQVLPYNDTMPAGLAEVYYDISQATFADMISPKDALQKLEDAANEFIEK